MNGAHLHLLTNHVPILLAIFSMILLVVGMVLSNEILKKTAMAGFIFAALFLIPVYLSGDPAEDAVKHLPGVTTALIEEHDDSAGLSAALLAITGFLSLVGFFFAGRIAFIRRYFSVILLILSFVASGAIAYTGYLGGMIRHTEVRSGVQAPAANDQENTEEKD